MLEYEEVKVKIPKNPMELLRFLFANPSDLEEYLTSTVVSAVRADVEAGIVKEKILEKYGLRRVLYER